MKIKGLMISAVLIFSSLVFYSVPPSCEAAVTPGRIVQIAVTMPQSCEAGVMEQLCSSVTSFLNDEAAKADTALKNCTKNCGWKKRKDDLVDAARKKAKESCARGEAPDINDINKGLDGNAKARLKNLYDSNSRMFDGSAKLAAANFAPVSPKNTAITGKGSQVTDLKASEPAIPKLNTASEFSLSGTKLSGGTSDLAASKQSSVLLASAVSAKTSADNTSASQAKSQTDATTAKTAVSADGKTGAQSSPYIYWCSCPQAPPDEAGTLFESTDYNDCVKQCCAKYPWGTDCPSSGCSAGQVQTPSGCCLASQVTTTGICCPPGQTPVADGTCGCLKGQVFTIAEKCEPESGPRSLTPEEKGILEKIFGASLNYKTIVFEHRKGKGNIKTSGQKIVMYDQYEDPQGAVETFFNGNIMNELGKSRFVHEAMHVWQRQHTNPITLWFQKMDVMVTEWIHGPYYTYNWEGVADRTSLDKFTLIKLNLEQQAEFVREYYEGTIDKKYKEYAGKIINEIRTKNI
ncbi:MAG: hypothetical protein HY796_07620 [Elusimicrobia bacterium]|nr:hypothetical protein [Elusimicrobiota bacterium]